METSASSKANITQKGMLTSNMSGLVKSGSPKAMALESIPDLIARLKREHALADEFCKHVQAFREQAGIPSMNEMRYAGYHTILALPSVEDDFDRDHLLKAIGHAQRATYEAAEAGILTCLDQIALFQTDYRLVSISDVVSDWLDILQLATDAQKRLKAQRAAGANRHIDHEAHKSLFDSLVVATRRLDAGRDDLNKKMNEKHDVEKRWYITIGVSIVLALIGIAVTVALNYNKATPPLNDGGPRLEGAPPENIQPRL